MKKPTDPTDSSSKSPALSVQLPVLDLKTATAVTPYRHEKTGRTVGYHQAAGSAGLHLFSPTGNFVETVPADVPPSAAPASSEAPAV